MNVIGLEGEPIEVCCALQRTPRAEVRHPEPPLLTTR